MIAMERRRLAWLLSLALMAVGGLVAHVAVFRLIGADPSLRGRMLHDGGHGYAAHWRACLAVCATVAIAGLVLSVAAAARRGRPLRVPVWLFAVVPPAGFVVQEHLERIFADGSFPYTAALEATFLVGVVLQIPFALAAFLTARMLLGLVDAVARRLGAPPRARLASAQPLPRPAADVVVARLSALALGHGQRAPPLLHG